MERATGGIVKVDQVHRIGDDCCSNCLPFPDPDYTLDAALMTGKPDIVIEVKYHDEEAELAEFIRKHIRSQFHASQSNR